MAKDDLKPTAKTRKNGLRSFLMEVENGLINLRTKIAGLEEGNYLLDVKENILKIGVIQKNGDKLIGVLNELITLPTIAKAQLLDHRVNGETLSITIAQY